MQLLVQHLADHELHVLNVCENYHVGGNRLLNEFIKERQRALQLNETQLEETRRQLSTVLERAEADVMDTLNSNQGRQNFKEQFLARQRAGLGTVEEALSRFTEEEG